MFNISLVHQFIEYCSQFYGRTEDLQQLQNIIPQKERKKKKKGLCEQNQTFLWREINEQDPNIALVTSSFIAVLWIMMKVSIYSKAVVEIKAGREASPVLFTQTPSAVQEVYEPQTTEGWGYHQLLFCVYSVLVLFRSHPLLASFRGSMLGEVKPWSSFDMSVPIAWLLFADCKQEERANKRFSAPGLSVRFASSLPTTLRCPAHQNAT